MVKKIKFFQPASIPIVAILGAGVVLRLWQIHWGLPELYEEATPMKIAWKFWNWGNRGFNFNPDFFNYPALTFYLQFLVQVGQFCVGYLSGNYTNLASFASASAALVVPARLVSVAADAGTIIVVYLMTKEVADRKSALIAALIVAINPLLVIHAHLIEVDPVLTFFCTLAMLYILRIYNRPERKWYILAGMSIALAASSKYTGAFLIAVLLGVHVMKYSSVSNILKSFRERSLIYSLLTAVGGFLFCNQYILFNFKKFDEDFSYEQFHVSYGHLGIVSSKSSFTYYVWDVLPTSFGWFFFVILSGTIIYFLVRRQKNEILFLIYPVVSLAVISMWEMRAERYILPIIPILSVIGAIGVVRLVDRLEQSFFQRKMSTRAPVRIVLIAVALVLIIMQPMLSNQRYLSSLGLSDTRIITKTWIQQNLPTGSLIATGPYGIEFPDTSRWIFMIPFKAVQTERTIPFYDARWYEDFDLLITSSYDQGRFNSEPEKYAAFLPYYDTLRTKWKLLFEVQPSEFQNGPSFRLYALPDSLRSVNFDTRLFQRMYSMPDSSRISSFLKELNVVEMHKGKYKKSEQLLKEILSVEPGENSLRNLLAQSLFNQKNYADALTQINVSLHSDSGQAKAMAFSGSIFLQLRRSTEAEHAFQKAISMDAALETPYQELIQLYVTQRQKLKLLDILQRYYSMLPKGTAKANEINAFIDQVRKIEE